MINICKQIFGLLSQSERKKALALFLLMLVVSMLDVVGVASVMPFTAILANPQLIKTNIILNHLYSAMPFANQKDFLLAIGMASFLLILLSLGFRAFGVYSQLKFTLNQEYIIGTKLLNGYLNQPYSWFLNNNSSNFVKSVLSEVSQVVLGGLLPILNAISQSIVSIIIVALLLIVDPFLAISVTVILTSAYALIYKLSNQHLQIIGKECVSANKDRFSSINEVFGAIKDVKFSGLEQAYLDRFEKHARTFAKHQASERIIGQLPRFGLESIAFGGMMAVLLYLLLKNDDIATALPIIALYAFAGYRLMPALQQVYVSIISIKFTEPALNQLYSDMKSLRSNDIALGTERDLSGIGSIVLNNVSFTYGGESNALNEIYLDIKEGDSIGLIGKTGSGKSTLIDILLNLLYPTSGALIVNGFEINEKNRRSWQNLIGYVPQQIYLTDDTIAANIAFGTNTKQINIDSLIYAAKLSRLNDFIDSLPNGFDTLVGERGVRLSGGQRQRIGIARALYRSPKILILDEATSALDNVTEAEVLESISKFNRSVTVIMVAHRLTTVQNCDRIYLLQNGNIVASGNHNELVNNSEEYRKLLPIS